MMACPRFYFLHLFLMKIFKCCTSADAFISFPTQVHRKTSAHLRQGHSHKLSFPSYSKLFALSNEEDKLLLERVAAEVDQALGVPLDQLINPSKVINLERDLVKLRQEFENASSSKKIKISQEIDKKEKVLAVEKRSVMQDWLKQLFVFQSALSIVIGGCMVYDCVPGFDHIDLSIRVLGFWMVWLFVIPSLRARKPSNPAEKKALNIAFIATPLVSLVSPAFTKDPVTIYWLNLTVCALCYVYGFVSGEDEAQSDLPKWVKFVFKALDFGSGRERGARK